MYDPPPKYSPLNTIRGGMKYNLCSNCGKFKLSYFSFEIGLGDLRLIIFSVRIDFA